MNIPPLTFLPHQIQHSLRAVVLNLQVATPLGLSNDPLSHTFIMMHENS